MRARIAKALIRLVLWATRTHVARGGQVQANPAETITEFLDRVYPIEPQSFAGWSYTERARDVRDVAADLLKDYK